MSDVDDAIERAEKSISPNNRLAEDEHWLTMRDRRILAAEVKRLRAQAIAVHRPTDPTHGRGGKTICACGELSWPCPALATVADRIEEGREW